MSPKIRAFLGLQVVKLVVLRDPYRGNTTFTIFAVTVHRVLSHRNSVVLDSEHYYIAVAEQRRLLYFSIEMTCNCITFVNT